MFNFVNSSTPFFKIIVIILIVYWIIASVYALIMLKKIFKRFPKNTKPVQQVPKQWNCFRRNDYAKWDRTKMLIGAFTRWPINFLAHVIPIFVCLFSILPAMIINIVSGKYKLGNKFFMIVFKNINDFALKYLTTIKIVEENEFYNQFDTPIIISNHVNWWDIYYIAAKFSPLSYVAKHQVSNLPLIGAITKFMQCIFVKRDKQTNRDNIVEEIGKRVQAFSKRQNKYDAYPVVIFPQGTCSNGRSIIRFKLGAFENRTPITVICYNYQTQNFEPGQDELTENQHVILFLCLSSIVKVKSFRMECEQKETAVEYMKRCQKKMAEALGYPIYDAGYREYIQYFQASRKQRYQNTKE